MESNGDGLVVPDVSSPDKPSKSRRRRLRMANMKRELWQRSQSSNRSEAVNAVTQGRNTMDIACAVDILATTLGRLLKAELQRSGSCGTDKKMAGTACTRSPEIGACKIDIAAMMETEPVIMAKSDDTCVDSVAIDPLHQAEPVTVLMNEAVRKCCRMKKYDFRLATAEDKSPEHNRSVDITKLSLPGPPGELCFDSDDFSVDSDDWGMDEAERAEYEKFRDAISVSF